MEKLFDFLYEFITSLWDKKREQKKTWKEMKEQFKNNWSKENWKNTKWYDRYFLIFIMPPLLIWYFGYYIWNS